MLIITEWLSSLLGQTRSKNHSGSIKTGEGEATLVFSRGEMLRFKSLLWIRNQRDITLPLHVSGMGSGYQQTSLCRFCLFSCCASSHKYVQREPTMQDGLQVKEHSQLLQSSACIHNTGNVATWGIQKSQGLDCSFGRHRRFKFICRHLQMKGGFSITNSSCRVTQGHYWWQMV